MTYQEILSQARGQIGPHCKACPVCNGQACRNAIPGPGAKGLGGGAIRNYQAWQDYRLNMDTLCENTAPDTSLTLFGRRLALPVMAGPVGAMQLHYGNRYDDQSYNHALVSGCAQAGILALTGDGTNPAVMESAVRAIAAQQGAGIPTVKPWGQDEVFRKLDLIRSSGACAVAMDIDAAGLPFLKNQTPPAGRKTVAELREIIRYAQLPFIVKGIMTVRGAEKAVEAGASAIVVSNHGGRVLDQCPATAEVLPEIAAAVKGCATVLVDGGIRTGADVFKALALGADAVLIARPFVLSVYGGGAEGPGVLAAQLKAELEDAMTMCGAATLDRIDRAMVRPLPR